jgi:hypothetical protein
LASNLYIVFQDESTGRIYSGTEQEVREMMAEDWDTQTEEATEEAAEPVNTDNWAEWEANQPFTLLEGIARAMMANDDAPATHEYSEVQDNEHRVLVRSAYGVSGTKYVYLAAANRVFSFPSDA